MKVHYIAQFGENNLGRNLKYSPAGQAKMNYIIDALSRTRASINVFSTCSAKNNSFYNWKKTTKENVQINVTYCSSFNTKFKYVNIIDVFYRQLQLFLYLLIFVSNEDSVVVYHERFYLSVLTLIRRIKKIYLIYEVEEVYTLAAKYSQKKVKKEISKLKNSDAYIFPNDLIAEFIGLNNKPFIVCYGPYNFEKITNNKFDDGKTHLVYAGTLDPKKGGALSAVELGKYLNENFHIHILGFGSTSDIIYLKSKIDFLTKNYKTKITYEGMLTGSEFREFIQKCHIGLSMQDPEGEYNITSFPSKILTYLSNDLFVITVKIKVLEVSQINNLLTYYESFEQLSYLLINTKYIKSNDSKSDVLFNIKMNFEKELNKILIKR